MADALPEHGPINPESPTLQEGDSADDAANPAIADGDAPTGVSILRRERYEDPRDLVGEPFIRLHESQYWRWYEQLKSEFKTRRASSQIADAFLDTAEMRSGLQIRKSFEISKFKFEFPRARTSELFSTRSRLYRRKT